MTETVSLKRPRSTSNVTEEPEEKYGALGSQPILVNPASLAAMTDRNGIPTTASFPLLQYYHMIHQMQNQMELPVSMLRKERDEPSSGSSSRRQTISTSSMTPRPIRVPTQPLFNPLQFFPTVPQLTQQPDAPGKSPSPARAQSPQHTYNVPSFQRADEEVFSKFVDSVRKLAAKLTAERS